MHLMNTSYITSSTCSWLKTFFGKYVFKQANFKKSLKPILNLMGAFLCSDSQLQSMCVSVCYMWMEVNVSQCVHSVWTSMSSPLRQKHTDISSLFGDAGGQVVLQLPLTITKHRKIKIC